MLKFLNKYIEQLVLVFSFLNLGLLIFLSINHELDLSYVLLSISLELSVLLFLGFKLAHKSLTVQQNIKFKQIEMAFAVHVKDMKDSLRLSKEDLQQIVSQESSKNLKVSQEGQEVLLSNLSDLKSDSVIIKNELLDNLQSFSMEHSSNNLKLQDGFDRLSSNINHSSKGFYDSVLKNFREAFLANENSLNAEFSFIRDKFSNEFSEIKQKVFESSLSFSNEVKSFLQSFSTDQKNQFLDQENIIRNIFQSLSVEIEHQKVNLKEIVKGNIGSLSKEIFTASMEDRKVYSEYGEKIIFSLKEYDNTIETVEKHFSEQLKILVYLQQKSEVNIELVDSVSKKIHSLGSKIGDTAEKHDILVLNEALRELFSDNVRDISFLKSTFEEELKKLGNDLEKGTEATRKYWEDLLLSHQDLMLLSKSQSENISGLEGLIVSFKGDRDQLTEKQTQNISSLSEKLEKYFDFQKDGMDNLKSTLPNDFKKLISNQNQFLERQFNITYDRLDALISIQELLDLVAPLPIMHEWRISSDYALAVIEEILDSNSLNVIDVGSGLSTILYGYALKKIGKGKVVSLEHSQSYLEKTQKLIKLHKLENYCEVNLCPLIDHLIDGEKWLWYDISSVNFPENVGVVSVDGPPGSTQYMARYPAVPILSKYLNERTVLFLDDGLREEEAKVGLKWRDGHGFKISKYKSHKGYFKVSRV